jgi:hypothetical protein
MHARGGCERLQVGSAIDSRRFTRRDLIGAGEKSGRYCEAEHLTFV